VSAPAPRPALTDWQRDLADYALHGKAAAATRLLAVFGHGPVPADEALEIHATTVHHALYSALRQRVPTVEALVGEDFLRELTRAFARHHPPRQPQLALWGTAFPAFVAVQASCVQLPYLAAVAAFDLALDEVALAQAGNWLEPLPLVAGLTLQWLDSLRIFSTPYATDQLRDAVAAARDGDEAALSAVSLAPAGYHYALWCAADTQVHCRTVSVGLAAFLENLLATFPAVSLPATKDGSDTRTTNVADRANAVESALRAALAASGTHETEAGVLFTNLLQELAKLGAVRLLQGQD